MSESTVVLVQTETVGATVIVTGATVIGTVPIGPQGTNGTDGEGVPVGGTEGQVLAKASAADFDTEWSDAAGGGAPTTADYLVGTAQAGLSAEIVVGATPGGELGGTWAAPTVDASHSGSTHAAVQAAAEATAAADATTKVAAEATLARNADNLTSGTVADARIASTIARDAEVAAAYATIDEPIAAAHIADALDAHDASAISILDTANDFTATDVEGALAELQADHEADVTALSDHAADTTSVHGIADTTVLETTSGAQAKADAKVAQTITNGVTTSAPSQDAVFDALALKADLASPALTGNPTAPTAAQGDNDTSIATTAFVNAEIAADAYTPGGTDVAVADGGTGASTAAGARTNLSVPADADVVHDTGDETIAGVKTFSSDPLIPDEAYDATAWNGSLEPPTKNAVRDKIESMGGGSPGLLVESGSESKVTALTELTSFTGDETFYVVEDDDGTPASRRITVENLAAGLAARAEFTAAFSPSIKVKRQELKGGGNLSTGSTTRTPIEATNLPYQTHTLAVGDMVKITLGLGCRNSTAGHTVCFDIEVDQPTSANVYIGAGLDGGLIAVYNATTGDAVGQVCLVATFVAAEAGSHGFRPVFFVSGGTGIVFNATTGTYDQAITCLVEKYPASMLT